MGFLKRWFGGREDADGGGHVHLDEDVVVPGWDAITAAADALHPGQEPMHWGTVVRWRLGGPDPLDGVSAYRADGPPAHWHYVTYGLTELYDKESEDPAESGWGFELTFRLRRAAADTEAPMWAVSMLQNLARYVFESGNVLAAGDHIDMNGPIVQGSPTAIRAIAFTADPELPAIDSPNGRVRFIQVVGLTLDEYAAIQDWDTHGLLELLARNDPLLVTDLERASLLDDPATADEIRRRTASEGSSMSAINVTRLDWSTAGDVPTLTVGALAVDRLRRLAVGRLGFGRPFTIAGPDRWVVVSTAVTSSWQVGDDEHVHLELGPEDRAGLAAVPSVAGTYPIGTLFRLDVVAETITDQHGNEIETVG